MNRLIEILGGLRFDDPVSIALAGGGRASGRLVWYRGAGRFVGVRLDRDPAVIVPVPFERVRRIAAAPEARS